ncbi:MAG: hypothetical protein J6386_07875 [Candidatus Synoicihabitans palmerolidicus]|nr:hypothetical protein [Candidatus Synoicihabitans palmerolidicus]
METGFERVLVDAYKAEMVAYIGAHPEAMEEAIGLAVTDRQPYAWRSAWLLESCMQDNDSRVRTAVDNLLAALPTKADGHQRELIKILSRMDLRDDQEGTFFNLVVGLWEDVHKKPAVRCVALKFILKMVEKYPDLRGGGGGESDDSIPILETAVIGRAPVGLQADGAGISGLMVGGEDLT